MWPLNLLLTMTLSTIVYADEQTLRLLTWEDYIDPEILHRFESETGISLELVYFENDELRDQIMAETNGFGFDLILVDEVELPAYIKQGWAQPLDKSYLPNLSYYSNHWINVVPVADGYAIPYGWGTYGIAYRSDLLKHPPKEWSDLFVPSDELAGSIQMPPQASELLSIALISLGYSPATREFIELLEAEYRLRDQKQYVYQYKSIDLDASLLLQGKVKATVAYSSDAMRLMKENPNINYIIPNSGSLLWIDMWVICQQSKSHRQAHTFMNYILDPEIAAQNMQHHYASTFSSVVRNRLPDDLKNNPIVFPKDVDHLQIMGRPNRYTIRAIMKTINLLNL